LREGNLIASRQAHFALCGRIHSPVSPLVLRAAAPDKRAENRNRRELAERSQPPPFVANAPPGPADRERRQNRDSRNNHRLRLFDCEKRLHCRLLTILPLLLSPPVSPSVPPHPRLPVQRRRYFTKSPPFSQARILKCRIRDNGGLIPSRRHVLRCVRIRSCANVLLRSRSFAQARSGTDRDGTTPKVSAT